jgi:hypothetical protein
MNPIAAVHPRSRKPFPNLFVGMLAAALERFEAPPGPVHLRILRPPFGCHGLEGGDPLHRGYNAAGIETANFI